MVRNLQIRKLAQREVKHWAEGSELGQADPRFMTQQQKKADWKQLKVGWGKLQAQREGVAENWRRLSLSHPLSDTPQEMIAPRALTASPVLSLGG